MPHKRTHPYAVCDSSVGSVLACGAGDPGSIPISLTFKHHVHNGCEGCRLGHLVSNTIA